MPLEVVHSPFLIFGSLVVAVMGAFTALRLTSNLRYTPIRTRKIRVSQGAFALGISIWSMHFIAMLAIMLPIPISYDPLRTLASALIAVLVVGMAFLSLHFGVRTRKTILIAGTLTGFGIAGMHYLGMSAISENIVLNYRSYGVVLAIIIGIAASIAALELAYGERSLLNIAIGAAVLGLAISAMHHTAMYFTEFFASEMAGDIPASVLDNEKLGLLVMVSSFVLCGLFLLSAVPFDTQNAKTNDANDPAHDGKPAVQPDPEIHDTDPLPAKGTSPIGGNTDTVRALKIPYEQNNVAKFMAADRIHAVKAEGHYTSIYNGVEKLFCPWSISHMQKNLDSKDFVRTHRSFLVNKHCIVGLKREGDKSFCVVGENPAFEIPIARANVNEMRKLLQMG